MRFFPLNDTPIPPLSFKSLIAINGLVIQKLITRDQRCRAMLSNPNLTTGDSTYESISLIAIKVCMYYLLVLIPDSSKK